MKYRSIFISDLHLGLRHSRVKDLLRFLKDNECDVLYLVGDIFDGHALGRRWVWNEDYNVFIQKLLRKARKGTKIIYITGNHDAFFRRFGNTLDFGNIELTDEIIHVAANGKRYLVIHGDIFDGIIHTIGFLCRFGSFVHDIIIGINGIFNNIRRFLGMDHWSLSYYIVLNKDHCDKFEKDIIKETKYRKLDGAICGHTHYPCQKVVDGVEYHNTGCWTELATAIVEHEDGRLELIDLDK